MYEDLDDPFAPNPQGRHRVEVARRVREVRLRRRLAMAGIVVIVVAAGATLSTLGGAAGTRHQTASNSSPKIKASTPTTVKGTPSGAATTQPCPSDSNTPSMASGSYCGPAPHAGNGLGPNGECDGHETLPPCGAGAVVGTYYAYTEPQDCAGNPIYFDGRLWYSTLGPPANLPDTYVWMALEPDGQLEAISPTESIGFNPDTGQAPVSTCKTASVSQAPTAGGSPTLPPTTTMQPPLPSGPSGNRNETVSAAQLGYGGITISTPSVVTTPLISSSAAEGTATTSFPGTVHDVQLVSFSDVDHVPAIDEVAYAVEMTPGTSLGGSYFVVFVSADSGAVIDTLGGS